MLYMYIDEGVDKLYSSNFIDKSNEKLDLFRACGLYVYATYQGDKEDN